MVLTGLLAGVISPIQASFTKKLKQRTGSVYYAGAIGYVTACLTAAVLFLIAGMPGANRIGALAGAPFWTFLGGPIGILFITGNVLLIEKIGGVQMVIFPALGQILTGLVVDHFGLFRSAVIPMTSLRLIGGVLVIAGVALAAAGGRQKKTPGESGAQDRGGAEAKSGAQAGSGAARGTVVWQIFGIVIGAFHSFQTAINGYFGRVTGSPLLSTTLNFTIGSVVLLAICLLLTPRIRRSEDWNTRVRHLPAWLWPGSGVLGAVIIILSILVAGRIGTGMAAITYLTGSSAGGVLIDQFGLFGAAVKKMNWKKLTGIAVMVAGAAICQLAAG